MKKKLSIIFAILIILGVGAYFCLNSYMESSLQAIDPNDEKKILVKIPEGSSTSDIAKILSENDLIRDIRVFKYYSKKIDADSRMKAGKYSLSRSLNTEKMIEILINGGLSGNTVNITIIEGLTLEETAQSIVDQLGLNYDTLINIMENVEFYREEYKFLMDNPNIKNLQGFLMPDTYNVYLDSNEENIVKMLISQFDSFYKTDLELLISNSELTLQDTMNLASIVEKEAVLDEERDDIAATFLNRLSIDMKLQSCATVNYAQGVWKERLTNSDLAVESPYNTYLVEGLPPTPINSPGKMSIKAVLEPADVDYLYFVSKGDGSHQFSNNYDDHLAAKNKYLD